MSINKKSDPRTSRSRKVLKKAVASLLSENPSMSALTVKKITDEAELNRATFYLHFEDINDLLRQLVSDIIDDLSLKLLPLLEIEQLKDEEKLLTFLDYFYQNRKLFAVLFEKPSFKTKMYETMKSFIQARRNVRAVVNANEPASLDIIAASLLGIIMWWIKEGTHFSSQYIANQISQIHQNDSF